MYTVEARRVLLYIIITMWGQTMEEYADILEHELESAVEVKDKDSLHRAVLLVNFLG